MKTFRRRSLPIIVCVVVGLTFFLSMPEYAKPAEVVVKFGHLQPPGSQVDKDCHFFAELVKVRSGGKIEVQVFPSAVLGKQIAMVEGCIAGTHDMTYGVSAVIGIVKKEGYWDLPFLFKDRDAVTKLVSSPLMKQIEQNYLDKGLVLVGYGELGYRQFTNNVRPIYRPADLKGIKHRVAAGPTKIMIFKTFGANPTPLAFSELYQALKQGVVDGQDNPMPGIYGSKLHEVQKYLSLVGYVYNPLIIVAGKPFWNRIPEWARVILKEAGRDAGSAARYKGLNYDTVLTTKFAELGMKVNPITEEDRKAWEKASEPIYEALTKDIGKEFLQQIMEVVR